MQFALAPGTGFVIESPSDLDQYFTAVAAAGFDGVTLGSDNVALFEQDGSPGLHRATELLAASGLFCSDLFSIAIRRQERALFDEAQRLIDAAAILEARSVGVLCLTDPTNEIIDRFNRIADRAQAADVMLSLEFGSGIAVNSIAAGLAIVDQVGPDRIGLVVDTYHYSIGPSTWADLETVPLDSVLIVQFDDAASPVSDDLAYETTNRRRWPGEGELELERFADTLKARGWDGIVCVEVLSPETRALSLTEFTQTAYRTSAPYWR
jgi:sugar phosphate isomerase/epimerase